MTAVFRQGLAVGGVETSLVAPLERRVAGDEIAGLEDADLVGKDMNVEDAAARRVRHAVQSAAVVTVVTVCMAIIHFNMNTLNKPNTVTRSMPILKRMNHME